MKNQKKLLILMSLLGCQHPLDYFYNEIGKYGYIAYESPMKYSGTGTLIGGTPMRMQLIASPETCFPFEAMEHIRYTDDTILPSTSEKITVDSNMSISFFEILKNASPSIKGGADIKNIKTINLDFEGVTVEALDAVKLVGFYRHHMSDECKDYLDQVGFIVQAIRVEKMRFTMFDKNDSHVWVDANNIQQYIDVSLDVKWSIEKNISLVIETPKYIGYQLGVLRHKDNGISLFRATNVKFNKWVFDKTGIFDDLDHQDDLEQQTDGEFPSEVLTPQKVLDEVGFEYKIDEILNQGFIIKP